MRRFLFASLFSMVVGTGTAAATTLDDLQWQYRVIAIFAPTDTRAAEIRDTLENDAGVATRDIAWFVLSPDTTASNIDRAIERESLLELHAADGFEAVLVGKDGGVKSRQTEELDMSAFYDEIDAMPMRQREMSQ